MMAGVHFITIIPRAPFTNQYKESYISAIFVPVVTTLQNGDVIVAVVIAIYKQLQILVGKKFSGL